MTHFPELLDPVSLEQIRAESLKPLPKPTNEPLVLHNNTNDTEIPNIPFGEEAKPGKKKEKKEQEDKKKKEAENASPLPLILILVAIIIAILNANF
jgi:hypothetical protein